MNPAPRELSHCLIPKIPSSAAASRQSHKSHVITPAEPSDVPDRLSTRSDVLVRSMAPSVAPASGPMVVSDRSRVSSAVHLTNACNGVINSTHFGPRGGAQHHQHPNRAKGRGSTISTYLRPRRGGQCEGNRSATCWGESCDALQGRVLPAVPVCIRHESGSSAGFGGSSLKMAGLFG